MRPDLANKNAYLGPIVHFMSFIRSEIGSTSKAENFYERVIGLLFKEAFNGQCFDHRRREVIYEKTCCLKGMRPIFFWNECMGYKENASFNEMPMFMYHKTILFMSV